MLVNVEMLNAPYNIYLSNKNTVIVPIRKIKSLTKNLFPFIHVPNAPIVNLSSIAHKDASKWIGSRDISLNVAVKKLETEILFSYLKFRELNLALLSLRME